MKKALFILLAMAILALSAMAGGLTSDKTEDAKTIDISATTLTQDELKELFDATDTIDISSGTHIVTCYWIYDPQPDITAYELALLIPVLEGLDYQSVDGLNKPAQRHFKQVCN